ncbi:hypothetical protein OpiT1DRAFT_04752 [Opitutaceae bacterium TAV1]|nr:hypothetical protein OpiT1DRAFT_04752 [Opitutaceae bacterium TAV1]
MNIQACPTPRLYTRPPLGVRRVILYATAGVSAQDADSKPIPRMGETTGAGVSLHSASYGQTYFPPMIIDGPPHSDAAAAAVVLLSASYAQTYFPPVIIDGPAHSNAASAAVVLLSASYAQTYWPPVPVDRAFTAAATATVSLLSASYADTRT